MFKRENEIFIQEMCEEDNSKGGGALKNKMI
jgi:hypothetical protein